MPLRPLRETPFSRARRLAGAEMLGSRSSDVSRRPLDPVSSGSGAGVGAGAGVADSEEEDSSFAGAGGAASPPASLSVNPSKALTSVPASTRMAMGCSGGPVSGG